MALSKRNKVGRIVREICARLNAPCCSCIGPMDEDWFPILEENTPVRPDRMDAYVQDCQQQLRKYIWCGPPVRRLVLRPEGTNQNQQNTSQNKDREIVVTYRTRETKDGSFVEFLVLPLPAGQIALSQGSFTDAATELETPTRGDRCFLDPTEWAKRLTALSWDHLFPCIYSPLGVKHVDLVDEEIKAGVEIKEDHTAFHMPERCCFTEEFLDNTGDKVVPLLNVLRSVDDVATLYLGVGDGDVGKKGIVLGASEGLFNTIAELVWCPPRIFPPLLREEVAVEALALERPPLNGIVVAVTCHKMMQDAIIETNGRCWVVRERYGTGSILGVVFSGPVPQKYVAADTFNFDENIHLIEVRDVIRIRIRPSEEARVGTHVRLLQHIGVLYQPRCLFSKETELIGKLDALSVWLRLQIVQPSLQAWFVNDTNLKVVITPSHIPASKLLHCRLPASFYEVNCAEGDDDDSLQVMLSNRTVASRFAIIHADRWSHALGAIIHQDIKQYRTTWNAVLLVPLNIKLEELQRIVQDMVAEQIRILAVLPVGLKQRLFPTNFTAEWKNEWTKYDIAEPIVYDSNVTAKDLRMVFSSWIFPEDKAVERGPPSWELVANGYVIKTTAARCLCEAVNLFLTKSPIRIHYLKILPDSTFSTCGKTCAMRRAAWDLDQTCVVLWMAKPNDFTPDFVNGIQRAMHQSQKAVVLFCDFECPEDRRRAFNKSLGSLEHKIVVVFSGEASSTTPIVEEIPVSPIWEPPELEALGKKLAAEGFLAAHATEETQRALGEALKYSREDSSHPMNRHFFILVLAAARGHFVPAWQWVKGARKETKALGDALAFLRVMTDREDQWKLPLDGTEHACDLWVACQSPHIRDTRRWFAFAHPFLACLHLHLSEAGDRSPQNQAVSLIDDLPSPNALSKLWETTTEIVSGRLIETKVISIAQDVLQTRRLGHAFSRFSEAFLIDPTAFESCVTLPRTNRLRLQEPHASVLVSRVYREAGWFTHAWNRAFHAQEICPSQDAALLALTRNNRVMVVARMAVQTCNFEQAKWAWNEFETMLRHSESLKYTAYDQKKAREISDQIDRVKTQMNNLESHFPGLVSNDTEEEFIFGHARNENHWDATSH